jgi:hypothetical protein
MCQKFRSFDIALFGIFLRILQPQVNSPKIGGEIQLQKGVLVL